MCWIRFAILKKIYFNLSLLNEIFKEIVCKKNLFKMIHALKASIHCTHHFLENSAKQYPEKEAVVFGKERITYKQINDIADRIAFILDEIGVENGDRVVILLENSVQFVAFYYGCLKAGAVAVPLFPEIKKEQLQGILNDLNPATVIISGKAEPVVRQCNLSAVRIKTLFIISPECDWRGIGYQVVSWAECINPEIHKHRDRQVSPQQAASIIYTSSTTGRPKGVVLSHENIVSNTWAICECLELTHNDIQLVVLPFSYVMGASLLNTHMAVGGTVVINNAFAYTAAVLKQMVDEKITGFSGVPSTYAHLLYRSPLAAYRDSLISLRYCSQAGGHMPDRIKTELRNVLPAQTAIFIMYGATEASARLTVLDPSRFYDKMGSIGTPIPGVTLKVINENYEEAAPNETGELVASGPNIMKGYWNDDVVTRSVIDRNGYHTGDIGYRDEEGFYFVTGRRDLQIKVRGHRINPQEIEDALISTGQVVEAVVLAVEDRNMGSRLHAFVSLREKSCERETIRKLLANNLPKFKVPDAIVLLPSIPKNANGKPDRNACRNLAMADELLRPLPNVSTNVKGVNNV
jgi:long-chain acyl-CoA synthetase